jgi:hypothetical protein
MGGAMAVKINKDQSSNVSHRPFVKDPDQCWHPYSVGKLYRSSMGAGDRCN